MEKTKPDKIIVAFDLGTSHSGVAFQYAGNGGDDDRITVIKSWPGGHNLTSDEQAPPVKGTPFPDWLDEKHLKAELKKRGKSGVDIVADFLIKLHTFAMGEISKKFSPVFVETTPLEYILTVPAIWSDSAKRATLRAAEIAVIVVDVPLLSEPEAAAVEALSAMKAENVQEGDVFVVCDAGGGTVDLITYEFETLTPLRFREVVPGSGGSCGAYSLNVGFEELVRKRLGLLNFCKIRRQQPKTWATALQYFEQYVKRNFNPAHEDSEYDDCGFSVPFPGFPDSEKAGISFGFLSLSQEEVAGIFNPVVDEVLGLVKGQVSASKAAGHTPNCLILVGGFGQSEYLFDRIKQRLNGIDNNAMSCIQAIHAWTACLRGAVLRGMAGMELVTSRKARLHHGVICCERFVEGKHDPKDKSWSKL
ncbi:Heat shock protein 12B [Elsinoe australis]|uniref:Heat shock protein 12B n=1 Tax=Elsinoe australis TaxID=40998 RepID=A0A2P7YW58_9PEZI|nr:Heat shock protein 12B [Elsinoe australis]